MRHAFHQAPALKAADGLSQRPTTDAKLGGEIGFSDARPGQQAALQYGKVNRLTSLVDKRRGRQPCIGQRLDFAHLLEIFCYTHLSAETRRSIAA
jgi:hypothetical protein